MNQDFHPKILEEWVKFSQAFNLSRSTDWHPISSSLDNEGVRFCSDSSAEKNNKNILCTKRTGGHKLNLADSNE